ncbi:MAG: APC family permease [Paracoccaceae bacterium]
MIPDDQPHLRRGVGLALLTLYGVGVMVGAGIFVLVGETAGLSGRWAPLAFLIAALVAAPTAASYAELAARIPEAGGEAAYLRDAFGLPWLPQLAAVMICGGAVISASAVLQGSVGYMRGFIDLPADTLIVITGLLLGLVALSGVVESLRLLAAFTVLGIGGLLFVAAGGLFGTPAEAAAPAAEAAFPVAGLAAATLLAFFAFIGFEDMVNMAEETRDPGRTVPRALGLALAITAGLYALVVFAALRAVPAEALAASERPLALVVERSLGRGGVAFAVVAVFSTLNGVLAQILMASRLLYGAARDVPALAFLATVNERFRTPGRTTVLATAVVIGVSLAVPLLELAATSATILLMAFCGMNLALIVLKRRRPPPAGAFSVPGWVPWLGLVFALAALAAPFLL